MSTIQQSPNAPLRIYLRRRVAVGVALVVLAIAAVAAAMIATSSNDTSPQPTVSSTRSEALRRAGIVTLGDAHVRRESEAISGAR